LVLEGFPARLSGQSDFRFGSQAALTDRNLAPWSSGGAPADVGAYYQQDKDGSIGLRNDGGSH
jgi:hypothetical protein